MKDEIHIGKNIKNRMKEEGRSANWLAKKLSCNRANIYKIYEKSDINIVRLLQISRALNYNFFNDINLILNKNNNQ